MRGRLRGCVVSHAADTSIGPSGCSALAQALPHLSALQSLDLGCNLLLLALHFGLICDCLCCMHGQLRGHLVSPAAGNGIGDSGCSALSQALPHLSALQSLNLNGNLLTLFCILV